MQNLASTTITTKAGLRSIIAQSGPNHQYSCRSRTSSKLQQAKINKALMAKTHSLWRTTGPNSRARTQWLWLMSMHDNLNLVLRRNQKPYTQLHNMNGGAMGPNPMMKCMPFSEDPFDERGNESSFDHSLLSVWVEKKGEEEIKVIVYGITAIDQVVFD